MKKNLFLVPLLAIALLSGCNNKKTPQSESVIESSESYSDSSSSSSSSSSESESSESSSSEDEGDEYYTGYYSSISKSLTGNSLLAALKKLINNSSVKVSYDWDRYEQADEDQSNKSNVILIYARNSVPKTAHVSGTTGWNREHTFPQSKMDVAQSKSDNHIIFASDNKVNGARGNLKMGVVNSGTTVNDYNGNSTTCKKSGSLFDPHNRARGIVARSTMYAAAMYGFDPEDNFESLETLLNWHTEYEVDSFDTKRNDVVYGNQKNRNPFVDHPEFGCKIWGDTNDATRAICGL